MIQSVSIMTAVTVSYVPQTLATLKSAHRNSDFDTYHVFVVDAHAATIDALSLLVETEAPYIDFFGADDLSDNLRTLYLGTFRYFNPFEVSCFAKYVGMLHLFSTCPSTDICVYIDSDIKFFGDVRPLVEKIEGCAVYLTPHTLAVSSREDEHGMMVTGWINAGFFALNKKHPAAVPILEWLIERISILGFSALHLGLFVDQIWLSVLPVLWHKDVFISDEVGLNVAYWNLDQRTLARDEKNKISVNHQELLMFHFSGFEESDDGVLSIHANISVEKHSVLYDLCHGYRNELSSVSKYREKVNDMEVISCSKKSLNKRIRICESIYDIDLCAVTGSIGLFASAGTKLDILLRKNRG